MSRNKVKGLKRKDPLIKKDFNRGTTINPSLETETKAHGHHYIRDKINKTTFVTITKTLKESLNPTSQSPTTPLRNYA